ncbi:hypothetical protein F2Q69_00018995 [Brassica cretica]|uniref:Uncharacterized protein n=1 Tax=Brassica cretica TaxID=69181 RepID=A0A8S9QB52_BRACR|nr:hypothetical protein F2Q69_00018995 [Brassica cretica]
MKTSHSYKASFPERNIAILVISSGSRITVEASREMVIGIETAQKETGRTNVTAVVCKSSPSPKDARHGRSYSRSPVKSPSLAAGEAQTAGPVLSIGC